MSNVDPCGIAEQAVEFCCDGDRLWGILTRPLDNGVGLAVLVIVGGPQYRVGSHRQFVQLARSLAKRGFPVLRFDHRGMGDSTGQRRSFENIEHDIRAAIDVLYLNEPALRGVALWGLCDGASAALMFGSSDPRVRGIIAANPWARDDASLAATHVRHYYGARLLQRDFWLRLLTGRFDWMTSLRSFASNLRRASAHLLARGPIGTGAEDASFRARMVRGLAGFSGQTLLLLSENDLTAREFADHAAQSAEWRRLLDGPSVKRVDLADSDHTFSRRIWRECIETATAEWLAQLADTGGSRASAGAVAAPINLAGEGA